MKLETLNTITKSQTFQSKEFEIEASPFAFQILTRQLYKNPIASIIRELVSNAIDSHIAANTTNLPIIITLPTFLDSTFTIEDQGTGLSPEAINNIYTVFFKSNRRESNNFIGGFGLGAKTPFAYSDQFIITSICGWVEYQYIALINEQGMPELNLVATNPTDKRNGLKIQIPIVSADQWKWSNEAQKILPWIVTHTKVEINCDLPKIISLLKSTTHDWEIIKSDSHSFLNVCIGNILYSVNHRELFKNNTHTWYGEHTSFGAIVLRFPIGKLDVTPNREDLNYNDKTIKQLEHAYLKTQNESVELTRHLIDQCDTYEEACIKYRQIATALYNWRWANGKTLCHHKEPNVELSSIVPLPDECKPCHNLTWSRRGRGYKIDGIIGKIKLTDNYTLWHYPPKTKYIRERIKEIPQASNTTNLLYETDDINKIEAAFNKITTSPVTCKDLTQIPFNPPYRSGHNTTLKTLYGTTIDPYKPKYFIKYFVKFNGDFCDQHPQWDQMFLKIMAETLDISSSEIVLLPKSKWSLAKKLDLENFLDEFHHIHSMIQRYMPNLSAHKTLSEYENTGITNFIHHNRLNPAIPTELADEISALFLPSPPNLDRLLTICRYLNIAINIDQNLKGAIKKFYKKYEPLIDERIYNPTVITAYCYYLNNRGE